MNYTAYYRKEVLNMENKGLQKVKQWTKDNKEKLVVGGFIASTTVAVVSIVRMVSKGEDVADKLDAVEKAVEAGHEVKIYLGV